jgi:hypothetical protein
MGFLSWLLEKPKYHETGFSKMRREYFKKTGLEEAVRPVKKIKANCFRISL